MRTGRVDLADAGAAQVEFQEQESAQPANSTPFPPPLRGFHGFLCIPGVRFASPPANIRKLAHPPSAPRSPPPPRPSGLKNRCREFTRLCYSLRKRCFFSKRFGVFMGPVSSLLSPITFSSGFAGVGNIRVSAKVGDGSRPPVTFGSSPSEAAGCRSRHRPVHLVSVLDS